MLSTQKKTEKKEFIELKSTCGTEIPLRGYKLIGLSGKAGTGTIDLVVTLWNQRTDKNGFFTIGGSGVENANIKVPNDYIKFRNSFAPSNMMSLSNFIINADKNLNAIVLLHDNEKLNPFELISLDKKKTYIRISDDIVELLKKYAIDLVVYGETTACDKCELFELIHNEFSNKQYTLREFSTDVQRRDISLNRCAFESNGFLPEKFKIGSPTPGCENDCSGPRFLLEDHILEVTPSVNSAVMYDDELHQNENSETCSNTLEYSSSIHQNDYFQVDISQIQNSIQNANKASTSSSCSSLQLYPEGGNTLQNLNRANNRKRHMGVDTDYSEDPEWKSTKHFR